MLHSNYLIFIRKHCVNRYNSAIVCTIDCSYTYYYNMQCNIWLEPLSLQYSLHYKFVAKCLSNSYQYSF